MDTVTVAKVAVKAATYAIDKPYDYDIPQTLLPRVRPGMRVILPFGPGSRRTEGIVLALEQGRPEQRRKSILTLLDETPVLDGQAIRLALWMRERWFCTVYDAARAMLPAGLYFSLQDQYVLAEGVDREAAYDAAGRSEHARRILELVFAAGSAEVRQLKELFGTSDPNPALKLLTDKGVLRLETSASRGVGDKTEQVASLCVPPEEALAQVSPRRNAAPVRYAVVELLCT
ncbi:MAG: primosomal protein N', partial [Flavonifractor sp.]|nr:primosomal protein N' [Flavonifractor sp.]